MRTVGMIAIGFLLAVAIAAVVLLRTAHHSSGAHAEPSAIETYMARRARGLGIPEAQRRLQNPVVLSDEIIAEGRAHFADHCALCHGNDGRGKTTIGQNLYPKAPDLTAQPTQSLSDGELFSIIENGIRLTGMPAWGGASPDSDSDSDWHHGAEETWHLVHFIRHLPQVTTEELAAMRDLNPKTRDEWQEEEERKAYLEGRSPAPAPEEHTGHHHH
jgi:mono/diheme cytochrome c family protein